MFDCPKQRNIQKSSFIATLLDGYQVALNYPSEHYLRGGFLVFRGQRLQEWMADDVDIALSERSPCFDLNAQRVVVGDIFFLRHQRVYLYLVDGGADVGVCQQVVESLVIVQI